MGKPSLSGPSQEYKKIDLEMANEIFLRIFNELEIPSKYLGVTLFFIWSKSYGLKGKRFMGAIVLFPKNSIINAASMD
ncbi:hypothetical protein GCM10007884_51560 [Methylobacterium brachythecii]|uniref:Uncharacterized protein n=1 Tax=Methylobacterium brachythecii TaxID=1176177 RepID=A0ABQ6DAU4_9HYPH|nr:hypothetical protein GCM10007884_51560 [Methylobacterium brachythecii]